jgi:RING-type zinc-finger
LLNGGKEQIKLIVVYLECERCKYENFFTQNTCNLNEICLICRESNTRKLTCGHYYHKNCIVEWWERTNKINCCMCQHIFKL